MKIETERLELIALTPDELKLWISDIPSLEKKLNCSYKGEPIDGFFLDILKKQYEITIKDPDNYVYHSFFFLIRKTDRVVVGSADFKDLPNENQEIEIGYGLGKEFEHNGYMTEAVKGMCAWALKQDSVKHIIAETYTDNIPSQNILKRCGFKKYKEGDNFWWKV